jgi:hypothetical protein
LIVAVVGFHASVCTSSEKGRKGDEQDMKVGMGF